MADRPKPTQDFQQAIPTDLLTQLKDGSLPQTIQWTRSQNESTDHFLTEHPLSQPLAEATKAYFAMGDIQCPLYRGTRKFQWKREGHQNHAVLYMSEGDSDERKVIDPNEQDPSGKTIIPPTYTHFTPDGTMMAYQISTNANEEFGDIQVKDTDTGEIVETIPGGYRADIAWLPNKSGFYYTRFQRDDSERGWSRNIYFHHVGKKPESDTLVFETDTAWLNVELAPDASTIVVNDSKNAYIAPINDNPARPENFTTKISHARNTLHVYNDKDGEYVYAYTDDQTPFFRVIRTPRDNKRMEDASTWTEIARGGHNNDTLVDFEVIDEIAILHYFHNGSSQLEMVNLETGETSDIQLPEKICSVSRMVVDRVGKKIVFNSESFTNPTQIYEFDPRSGNLVLRQQLDSPFDLSGIETRLETYVSDDGTPINMFVIGPSAAPDRNRPTVLTGYGGFGNRIATLPKFARNIPIAPLLAMGSTVALPHLRGGGEYGDDWHQMGKMINGNKPIEDMTKAAEWLFNQGITTPDKLAIWGKSHGGLVAALTTVLRPDICDRFISDGGLSDMEDFTSFGDAASLWKDEYGDPADPHERAQLRNISARHQIIDGVAYPAAFIVTGDKDKIVSPGHSRILAARLQQATSSSAPILFRALPDAGHGVAAASTTTERKILEIYAFLEAELAA